MQVSRLWGQVVVMAAFVIHAGSASAECAWVLWQRQSKLSPGGTLAGTRWALVEAAATETICNQLAAARDAEMGLKNRDDEVNIKGEGPVRIAHVCLPDTVDPRVVKR
jgi:hypothetical protein